MKTVSRTILLILVSCAWLTASPAWSQSPDPPGDAFSVSVENARVVTLRLEIFDTASERIYDSGPVSGPAVRVEAADLRMADDVSGLSYELRGWDLDGRLVFSQMAAVPEAGTPFSTISFETIPPDTLFGAPQITMAGRVVVQEDLRTDELRKQNGSTFFGSCASGSSIRSITATGTVTCEPDDVGTGGGDNLGNHVATQDLDMGSHAILFDNNTDHLRTDGNARLRSGGIGHTFMFYGGDTPVHDIVQFRDAFGTVGVSVNGSGRLHFHNGQKLCSVYDASGRDTLLVSDNWTASTCNSYRAAVAAGPGSDYQLFCLFDSSFTFGAAGGGIPSTNCGW